MKLVLENKISQYAIRKWFAGGLLSRAKSWLDQRNIPPSSGWRFDLVKWFAALSLVCIIFISVTLAVLQSRFLTDQMLKRDATITRDFIESIAKAEGTWSYFSQAQAGQSHPKLESFFNFISHMPDVMGANVYNNRGTILWSAEPNLIGKRFRDNDELDAALRGELVYESGTVGATDKEEHSGLQNVHEGKGFVETYVPIWDGDHKMVVGAVELYRDPRALQKSLRKGLISIWLGAGAGILFLFFSLFWIVRRANSIMEAQQQRLIDVEAMAIVGETAAVVVHSIRNPLASIRSSAEMALEDTLEGAREAAGDIISETDRLSRWTRDLLQFSSSDNELPEILDLNEVIRSALKEHIGDVDRQRINISLELEDSLPGVRANLAPMIQVFGSLLTNAIHAIPHSGTLFLRSRFESSVQSVIVTIRDTGPGMSNVIIGKAFRPFFSTKQNGTGLGLPLARRIVERLGGNLDLSSEPDAGLTATIQLPVAG